MADGAKSADRAVQAQLDRLSDLSPGGDRLGLDRITRLLDRLGNPQDRLPPVFHVAGTNGKGSACAFLRAILEASGRTVHAFTSPHLVRFNERIRVAGKLVSDKSLASLLKRVLNESEGIEPSFFEATAAAAFLAFAETKADACVIEVGLGGRLDATNVIERPLVCGIAGIGIDHKQWLGQTLAEIAFEKASIAKPGVPLVTQRYPPVAAQQVQQRAEKVGAPWIGRGALWDMRVIRDHIRYRDRAGGMRLPMPSLPGRYQADNAALAIAMLRQQDRFAVTEADFEAGLRAADWPARMQRIDKGKLSRTLPKDSELWVDGGHNPSAARLVADHVRRELTGDLPLVLLFASLKSKDPRAMLKPFRGLAAHVITLPIADHEDRSPEELAKLARSLDFPATPASGIMPALGLINHPARVLVFGSLYLAGEALEASGFVPS